VTGSDGCDTLVLFLALAVHVSTRNKLLVKTMITKNASLFFMRVYPVLAVKDFWIFVDSSHQRNIFMAGMQALLARASKACIPTSGFKQKWNNQTMLKS
jgi:hypothetical protein